MAQRQIENFLSLAPSCSVMEKWVSFGMDYYRYHGFEIHTLNYDIYIQLYLWHVAGTVHALA